MSNLVDVKLPADQAEGTESVAGTWFKAVGDEVTRDEPLLEISTDKVTVEIAAPATGVLQEIRVSEGDPIEADTVLGRIAVGDAAAAPTAVQKPAATAPATASGGRASTAVAGSGTVPVTELTPAVRRLLEQHGLDAASIPGTGRGGRITAQDVEQHLASAATPSAPAADAPTGPSRRVPHTPMRARIARHMVASMQTAPHVTTLFQADLSAVLHHKAALAAEGTAVTLTAYFVRAAVEGIKVVPEVNARWHDDALELFDDVNLGIATALEKEGGGGLIVPVLRQAQTLDLAATGAGIADLATRARAGTLTPTDVQGGTFPISNHGVSGSLLATPIIINQPQSAILGVGKLEKRVVVVPGTPGEEDRTEVRPMVYGTLTIDHRVLDGHQANRFLQRFVETLEKFEE